MTDTSNAAMTSTPEQMTIPSEATAAARDAILYMSHPDTPWSAAQVNAVLGAALPHLAGSLSEGQKPVAWLDRRDFQIIANAGPDDRLSCRVSSHANPGDIAVFASPVSQPEQKPVAVEPDLWLCSAPPGVWQSGRSEVSREYLDGWLARGYTCTPYYGAPAVAVKDDTSQMTEQAVEAFWNEYASHLPAGVAVYPVPEAMANVIRPSLSAALPYLSRPVEADPVERGEAVAFKPLEWHEKPIPPSGECLASSAAGLYCIPLGGQKFILRFRDKKNIGEFDTLDEAKAAGQAEYDQRIRAALAHPAPASPAGTDAKRIAEVEARLSERDDRFADLLQKFEALRDHCAALTDKSGNAEMIEAGGKARINLMHLSANLGLSEDADVLDDGAAAIEQLLAALRSPAPDRMETASQQAAEWYLDANDPESGHADIFAIMEWKPAGVPVEIHSAAIVGGAWHAKLPPADDADNDDDWECESPTEGGCLRLIANEKDRRASLNKEEGNV